MYAEIWNFAKPYLVGCAFAFVIGQPVIFLTVNLLYRSLGLPFLSRHGAWHSIILGLTELALYIGALIAHKPEFIAVWLAKQHGVEQKYVYGRNAYNIFLLGNALVVLFAAFGWKVIEFAKNNAWSQVFGLAGAVIVGSVVLVLLALFSPKYPPVTAPPAKP